MEVIVLLDPTSNQESARYPRWSLSGVPVEEAKNFVQQYAIEQSEQLLLHHGEGKNHRAFTVERDKVVGIEIEPED